MGTKHAGIPEPVLRTPPLGGVTCPDPFFAAGRGLVLQGPQAHLGALWVFTASITGQAAQPSPPVPPFPPPAPEGSLPFVDEEAPLYQLPLSPDEAEGAQPFADEV